MHGLEAETTFARLFRELALANTTLLVKQTQHSYFEDEIVPMLAEQTRDIEKIVELGEVDTFILLETVNASIGSKKATFRTTSCRTRCCNYCASDSWS